MPPRDEALRILRDGFICAVHEQPQPSFLSPALAGAGRAARRSDGGDCAFCARFRHAYSIRYEPILPQRRQQLSRKLKTGAYALGRTPNWLLQIEPGCGKKGMPVYPVRAASLLQVCERAASGLYSLRMTARLPLAIGSLGVCGSRCHGAPWTIAVKLLDRIVLARTHQFLGAAFRVISIWESFPV